MIGAIIISTMMVGIGGIGIGQPTAGPSTCSQTGPPVGSGQTPNPAIRQDPWKPSTLKSFQYIVKRESSKPLSGSPTGRTGSGPTGSLTDSRRDSSRPLDVNEDRSKQNSVSETERGLGESDVAPKKSRDPTKGGGDTPASAGRR